MEKSRLDMIPCSNEIKKYILKSFAYYWGTGQSYIEKLPISEVVSFQSDLCKVVEVELPVWGRKYGVDGKILVPISSFEGEGTPSWNKINWYYTMFWFMNGLAEQSYEQAHGSIHSYSYKLTQLDPHLWQYAWVNRIALFLRLWAANVFRKHEHEMFGHLEKGEILLTHDVDAVKKTFSIRLKQTTFQLYNCLRLLCRKRYLEAWGRAYKSIRFLLSRDEYWCFEKLLCLERKHDIISCFFFYGGKYKKNRSLKQMLIDPNYDVKKEKVTELMHELAANGYQIGVHSSVDSFNDSLRLKDEKAYVEAASGKSLISCRQHWLRFSWQDTWKAQMDAGLSVDMTLGFNDRCGFRNGVALYWMPWDFETGKCMAIKSLPMIIMDSHFYDYSLEADENKWSRLRHFIDEVYFVHGKASVLWHPHTLSADYGWEEGLKVLLEAISENNEI